MVMHFVACRPPRRILARVVPRAAGLCRHPIGLTCAPILFVGTGLLFSRVLLLAAA
jgi:hypothetical protein